MRNIWALFIKEIRVYFTTPVAYVALTVFTIVSSFFFLRFLSEFQHRILIATQMRPEIMQYLNFTDQVFQPLFYNTAVIFIFVLPFITMRLIAEERRARTFELLLTNPVTPFQIAAGKYLASLVVLLTMIGIVTVYPLLVWAYATLGAPAWGTVFTGMLGLFLVGAAFTAVGLFISSLTSSQTVAAAITFCTLLLLWVVGWAAGDNTGVTRDVLNGMSAIEHVRSFAKGVIDLKDVVYYLSLAFLGVFLTRRALEAQRWR